jgi:hypothetical protein
MPTSDPDALTSHEKAGVLLAARRATVSRGLWWPSVDEILAATGASAALAHEVEEAVLAWLPTLEAELAAVITNKALRFVLGHPGCVQLTDSGARYSARYRRFVIALRKQYADVSTAKFAEAIRLPLDTLEDLLAGTRAHVARSIDEDVRPRA